MINFVHHKLKSIDGFLVSFNELQRLLYDRSFAFETEFGEFLKQIVDYFNAIGDSSKEAEVLKFRNMLQTVRKGFDPVKLEKIKLDKREIFWGFAFHCSENLQRILVEIWSAENQKIIEAEEILSNLILSLYQSKVISDKTIKELNTVPKLELFWRELLNSNESISLIDKKLKTRIISEDIYLVLEKILANLNQ